MSMAHPAPAGEHSPLVSHLPDRVTSVAPRATRPPPDAQVGTVVRNARMLELCRLVERIARFDVPVVVLGETGVGKGAAQAALLRVLEDRCVSRVGGRAPVRVDVRLATATHRNLEAMVAAGSFRQDLWYRINTFALESRRYAGGSTRSNRSRTHSSTRPWSASAARAVSSALLRSPRCAATAGPATCASCAARSSKRW